jgi:hypothetical protein
VGVEEVMEMVAVVLENIREVVAFGWRTLQKM